MAASRPKVVWILGSGFSKHLGGPLLPELLTHRVFREIEHLFPRQTLPTRNAVYEIFRDHVKGTSNQPYWEHAEDFLAFVDSAASPTSRRHPLMLDLCRAHKTDLFDGTPQELRRRAAIAIATECMAFLSEIDLDTEAWEPYLRWGEMLESPDAIITFNYDRVLEELAEHPRRISQFSERTVQIPQQPHVESGSVPIYKLHGSVDWFFKQNTAGEAQWAWQRSEFAEHLDKGFAPLIATPGHTKKSYCDDYLSDLWKAARAHLREAEVVVFMGYRFPPSDSQALNSILEPINKNSNSVRVHIVLGPDTQQADTVRLEGLLRAVLKAKHQEVRDPRYKPSGGTRYFQILTHPLYAQDFMSVFNYDDLHGIHDPAAFLSVLQKETDGS